MIHFNEVMIRDCIGLSGAVPPSRLDGIFNSAKYLGMLSNIVELLSQENIPPIGFTSKTTLLCIQPLVIKK